MTRKKPTIYPSDFKMQVLVDYYSSGMSKSFIARRWSIANPYLISLWEKTWPIDSELLSLPPEVISAYQMKQDKPQSPEDILQQRITNLERALAVERMRSRAFEKMIEIAEKEEGISILKKGGAKQ